MKHPAALRVVLLSSFFAAVVCAQDVPIVGYHVATGIGWSAITNPSSTPLVSSPAVINHGSTPWLKLWFAGVDLGTASKIRVTGAQDDVVQVLDADGVAAW